MLVPVEWLPVLIRYISESMSPKEYEMTYVACSPIFMLIILVVAGVISILYELSITSTTNTAIATITPQGSKIGNKTAADRFGITEIYPTKPNG